MHPNDLKRLAIGALLVSAVGALRVGMARADQQQAAAPASMPAAGPSAAGAKVYKCPQIYPGKDRPAAPLTDATMAWGEDRLGLFAGDYSKPAKGGYDAAYPIPADQQAWLVCTYGSQKRTEWWIRLDPKVHDCTVHVREIKATGQSVSTWTVTTSCSGAKSL